MAANAPILLHNVDSSASIEPDNGVIAGSAPFQIDMGATSAGSASNTLTGDTSEPYESDIYSASEDDAEMSDGGVQIDLSSAHAEQLNAEMDLIDAEVMGPYNLAAIATDSAYHADLQQDDSLEGFTEYGQPDDTPELDYDIPGDDEDDELAQPGTHTLDPMSELSQQLQHIQDGQEEGELGTSAALHGSIHNSTDSFSSPFPVPWVPGSGQDGLPYLYDVVSATAPQGSLTTATAGSLLGVHIDGQEADPAQTSSDMDWAADGDSEEGGDEVLNQANSLQVEDQRNLALREFLYNWGVYVTRRSNSKKKKRGPNLVYLEKLRGERPTETRYSDLLGEHCDFQGIDWTKLEVSRKEARRMRNHMYKNYTNLRSPVWHNLTLRRSIIDDPENYFKFRRMDFRPQISLSHFQLRNLLACTSRNSLYYAGEESKIYIINPLFDQKAVRMDLADPVVQTANSFQFSGIQISTIAADHNVLIAGGFAGEYGMTRLDSPLGADHIEGLITDDPNPITNHIQIYLNRHSGLPQAAFASNDTGLRILDCTTNNIVAHHQYDYAINCSAISPDHRLRVIVGDNCSVMICNAERGEVLQDLAGHVDYGFACAWADNGWHVATGNQDKLIKIWDARMWTDQHGVGKPLETLAATMAGVRSLKFSPLGSGKRVLVAAEAADIVSIIDAETYATKQTFDFFGEIGGVDFTPDGQALFVGIHDSLRGGIMEFEKCGFGVQYELSELHDENDSDEDGFNEAEFDEQASGLDWRKTDEEVVGDPRSKRTLTYRHRKAARSWDMEAF